MKICYIVVCMILCVNISICFKYNIQLFFSTNTRSKILFNNINDNFNLGLSKYEAKVECFNKLRSSHGTYLDFEATLNELKEFKFTRDKVHSNVARSINQRLVQFKTMLPNICSSVLQCLRQMRFTIADFDNAGIAAILSACETSLMSHSAGFVDIIEGLSFMKFSSSKFTQELNKVIDTSLSETVKSNPFQLEGLLSCLGHLKFQWTKLSDANKSVIQSLLLNKISTMSAEQLNRFLFTLKLMQASFIELDEIGTCILQAVEHYANTCSMLALVEFYDRLAQIKCPYSAMSRNLQLKVDEAFRFSFSRRDTYALFYLIQMKVTLNDCSDGLRQFILNDVPSLLVELSDEDYSRRFKLWSSLVTWTGLSTTIQDLILQQLTLRTKGFSEKDHYFALQGLICMYPPIDDMPEYLQNEILSNVAISLEQEATTSNGFCFTVDCMSKMDMKYARLPETMKTILDRVIIHRLPTIDEVGVTIIVDALEKMGLKYEQFSKELQEQLRNR